MLATKQSLAGNMMYSFCFTRRVHILMYNLFSIVQFALRRAKNLQCARFVALVSIGTFRFSVGRIFHLLQKAGLLFGFSYCITVLYLNDQTHGSFLILKALKLFTKHLHCGFYINIDILNMNI